MGRPGGPRMTTERPDRPFILVTNDDGIEADGIWHLAEALLEVGDVMICAPAFQQSGTGTSLHDSAAEVAAT